MAKKATGRTATKKTTTKKAPTKKGGSMAEKVAAKGGGVFSQVMKAKKLSWKKARTAAPKRGGFTNDVVPDGKYVVRIVNCGISTKDKEGVKVPSLWCRFVVTRGEYAGSQFSKFIRVEDQEGLERLSVHLQCCGIGFDGNSGNPDEEINSALESMHAEPPVVWCNVKQSDTGYQNVYVNEPVADEEVTDDDMTLEAQGV